MHIIWNPKHYKIWKQSTVGTEYDIYTLLQVILAKGKTDKEIRKRKLEKEEEEASKKSTKLTTQTKGTVARDEKVFNFYISDG